MAMQEKSSDIRFMDSKYLIYRLLFAFFVLCGLLEKLFSYYTKNAAFVIESK